MRISSVEARFSRRAKRKNIFLRIFAALHVSRRRDAWRVMRHHSHLVEDYSGGGTSNIAADSLHQEESSQNAHGNKITIRADDRTRRIANPSFWDQPA
jgi:hypothetical protein